MLKIGPTLLSLIACILSFSGCQESTSPAYLSIDKIEFEQTGSTKFLDLPNGFYTPDDPGFHPDKPETWTGNMAQYVKHLNYHSVSYQISNSGGSRAFNVELDMYYTLSNREEIVITINSQNIEPGRSINQTTGIQTINTRLVRCEAEVFWNY